MHSGKSRRHFSSSEPYFCEQLNTFYTHKFINNNQINDDSNKNLINKYGNAASTSQNVLIF